MENSSTFLVNDHNVGLQTRKYQEYFYSKVDPADKLDLLENRGFKKPIVAQGIALVKNGVGSAKTWITSLFSSEEEAGDRAAWEREAFLKLINDSIKIDLMKESHVIRIGSKGPNRDLAASLANQYAKLYSEYLSEEERNAARTAYEFLSEQEERYRTLSQTSTQELNRFRLEHEILDDSQLQDPINEQVKLIYAARANERIALTQAETVVRQVEKVREAGQSLLTIQAIALTPSVQELTKAVGEQQREYDAQRALLGDSHMKVREAAHRANAANQQLRTEIERTVEEFANRRLAADQKILSLNEQLRQVEVEVVERGGKGIELANLAARAQSDKKTYEQILAKKNEARVEMESGHTSQVRVIGKAVAADKPFRPNKPLSAIMSGFVFMATFIGLPLALGLSNDMTRRFGIRVPFVHRNLPTELGSAPLVPGSTTMHMLAEAFSPGSAREALFKLAKNLDKHAKTSGRRMVLVTSAAENEGKSFVAAALGGAFCSQGRRTLIIDCNLHSPSMNLWFPNLSGKANLVDWLESDGTQNLDIETLRHGGSDLFVLPSHGWAIDPSRLLMKPCFGQLLQYTIENFDFVLLDGPQIEGHPDAEILARHATEIAIVSDRKLSDYRQLTDACSKLGEGSQNKIIGLITNRSDQSPL